MNRWMTCFLLAAGLTLAGVAQGWTESWQAIRAAAQNVHSIETDFVQTKRLKILARPVVSRGKMSYRSPMQLRWEYSSPIQSVLIMNKGDVHRYLRRGDQFVADSSVNVDAMKVVLSEIHGWLEGKFTDSKTFRPTLQTGSPARVELVPIEPAMRQIIAKIVITLGSSEGVVESIDIVENEDASTRIEFVNTRLNMPLSDALFAPVQ
jgi:outer membrane lipoprotein-sorting protein